VIVLFGATGHLAKRKVQLTDLGSHDYLGAGRQ
jgi:glucose-6-phosphate 1-dehydrogenase